MILPIPLSVTPILDTENMRFSGDYGSVISATSLFGDIATWCAGER